jgi:2-polyprenyl-3-methyl-5-hydroxy-6-metoxy-1,4-benzoquinol methylase
VRAVGFADAAHNPRKSATNFFAKLGYRRSILGTELGRSWRQRVEGLLACEVDYTGKAVLDAGCNVGILAYEIAKRGPAFIHAIDGSRPMLNAARLVFRSVETPHRLDLVDLTDDRSLRDVLAPHYDVILLLAVYQPLERASGDRAARRVLATLAERCRETLVVAAKPSYLPSIIETLVARHFCLEREIASSSSGGIRHLVFRAPPKAYR